MSTRVVLREIDAVLGETARQSARQAFERLMPVDPEMEELLEDTPVLRWKELVSTAMVLSYVLDRRGMRAEQGAGACEWWGCSCEEDTGRIRGESVQSIVVDEPVEWREPAEQGGRVFLQVAGSWEAVGTVEEFHGEPVDGEAVGGFVLENPEALLEPNLLTARNWDFEATWTAEPRMAPNPAWPTFGDVARACVDDGDPIHQWLEERGLAGIPWQNRTEVAAIRGIPDHERPWPPSFD